jgi:hypothetical protein
MPDRRPEQGQVAQALAWDRVGLVPEHDFLNRYSMQHIACPPDAEHALCGTRIRWLFISPGDGRRCQRCFSLAAKRGLVDEYGQPIAER